MTQLVDRLWPDPQSGLPLDAAFLVPDRPGDLGRPWVATNMVTSVDGRAQLAGTAEGLGSRVDRRLMQAYRAGFDAVGSGSGTILADDFYSRLSDDLAAARVAAGRPAQPLTLVVAGSRSLPADRRWFGYADQQRILAVGAGSPHAAARLSGVETWVAPTEEPEPAWLLDRLAAGGVGSLLLEGGPTLNAAFLAAGLLDELFWTIGPLVVANDALPMVAPAGLPAPRVAELVSVHRHANELFLRYRIASR